MSDLAAPVRYQDRSTGLILVGILEICLALLCLVMLAFMGVAALSAMAQGGVNGQAMLGSGLFYLLLAAFFAVMGIGTLRGRRWARTLMLVMSWIWLIAGVFAVALTFLLLPRVIKGISDSTGQAADPSVGMVVTGCASVFLILFYLVLPGILVLFYRGPNVQATFEAKDPSIPWTDRVPASVLALALMLAFGAVSSLTAMAYGVLPVFGTLLTGIPAILAFLSMGLICALLAWGVYHRRPAAWWALLGFWIFGCVNSVFFFRAGGSSVREVYVAMGTPPAQLEMIDKMGLYDMFASPVLLVLDVVLWLGWLGFLIWVKRFFPGGGIVYTERSKQGSA
ncbi:MAG: hypothetical protein JF614_20605 [Acidobacteria bacterium]|nr:hypothetical protein [Acidobacteriota bacterium]